MKFYILNYDLWKFMQNVISYQLDSKWYIWIYINMYIIHTHTHIDEEIKAMEQKFIANLLCTMCFYPKSHI